MTIAFPDGVAERIEALARQHGFSSAADYLMSLVESAEAEADAAPGGPPELTPRNRAELEAMLEVGMNSGPPIRATPEFWEERRRVLLTSRSATATLDPNSPTPTDS